MDASLGYSAAQALRSAGREPLRQALLAARERTLAWAQACEDALGSQAMRVPYRGTLNPPLWELGHIAWFQEYWIARNRQRARGVACEPGHARRPSLLAQADAWFDSGRVVHASRWELPLPGPQAIRGYLQQTLSHTLELLDALPADAGDDHFYFFRLTALHEEMHAEAGLYMARDLGIAVPGPACRDGGSPATAGPTIDVPAQRFLLGYAGPGFAFDNELSAHEVELDRFEIDAAPVSWSRFLAFLQEGGYSQRQWWSDEGWAWVAQAQPAMPAVPARDLAGAVVHVNAWEAQAWCRWAGRRLPTEAEWECAALQAPGFEWGQVWEWTASAFLPYPGFVAHPYLDYSQPWFGSRRVLRGASVATADTLAHPRYRNFFEPQRRDIFAGFRSCA
ncbi:MAG TPA: selenoneine synthase SenA [Ramlibacter sp.]|nr:selenoneine synthase SenA [Ramlibacter sp.]